VVLLVLGTRVAVSLRAALAAAGLTREQTSSPGTAPVVVVVTGALVGGTALLSVELEEPCPAALGVEEPHAATPKPIQATATNTTPRLDIKDLLLSWTIRNLQTVSLDLLLRKVVSLAILVLLP
jgi:hypothetical protein